MENPYCSFEQSVALKEIGFNLGCLAWYNPNGHFLWKFLDSDESISTLDLINQKVYVEHTLAPQKYTVINWFRFIHGLHTCFFVEDNKRYGYQITYFLKGLRIDKPIKRGFKNYEEAEVACIDELIILIKSKDGK